MKKEESSLMAKSETASQRIGYKVTILFSLSLLVIITAGYIAYKSFTKLTNTIDNLAKPNVVLISLQDVLTNISKAETSIRSYASSGRKTHLNLYYSFIDSADTELTNLKELMKDSSRRELVDSIYTLLDEKKEILGYYIQLQSADTMYRKYVRMIDAFDTVAGNSDTVQRVSHVTIDTLKQQLARQPEKKEGLFSKIAVFLGLKKESDTSEMIVKTPGVIKTDSTYFDVRQKNELTGLKQLIYKIQQDIATRSKYRSSLELKLLQRDFTVMKKIETLINELIDDETRQSEQKKINANYFANQSIQLIGIIFLVNFISLFIFLFLIFRDISKSNKYRRELIDARRHAEKLTMIKAQFLANMSHEVRTPLTAIIGFNEQLLKTSLNEEQTGYSQIIHSSSEHLLSLVNEILTLSKIEAGKITLDETTFILPAVIEDVCDVLVIKANEKGISLRKNVDSTLNLPIVADEHRIKQVIINLMGNAIKFTEKGFVEIEATREDDNEDLINVVIKITDTGIGIPEDKAEDIFNEFSQSDISASKKYGGTGLGLTISKRLIELHHGTITVQSKLGEGSVFEIKLPLKAGKESDLAGQPADSIAESGLLEGKELLLVDDDRMNNMLGKLVLEGFGIKTHTASGGQEALDMIREKHYDAVLMDVHMPNLSGPEVTRIIRKEELETGRQHQLIIALTANVMKEDTNSFLEAGMDSYIFKPFREVDMYIRLCNIFGLKIKSPEKREKKAKSDRKEQHGITYDLTELKRATKNDIKFYIKMLTTFTKNAHNGKTALVNLFNNEQWHDLGEEAHRLKTMFRHLKITAVSTKLEELEKLALKTHQYNTIPSIMKDLMIEIDEATALISKEIEKADQKV
ncbi:MAG TPA: ATP-binding protein [Bacteroidales bacterium]|nr:ATP-binding protein [Bacteroidales bacterium]